MSGGESIVFYSSFIAINPLVSCATLLKARDGNDTCVIYGFYERMCE